MSTTFCEQSQWQWWCYWWCHPLHQDDITADNVMHLLSVVNTFTSSIRFLSYYHTNHIQNSVISSTLSTHQPLFHRRYRKRRSKWRRWLSAAGGGGIGLSCVRGWGEGTQPPCLRPPRLCQVRLQMENTNLLLMKRSRRRRGEAVGWGRGRKRGWRRRKVIVEKQTELGKEGGRGKKLWEDERRKEKFYS